MERLVELHTSFRELVTFFCTNLHYPRHHPPCLLQPCEPLKTASWGLLPRAGSPGRALLAVRTPLRAVLALPGHHDSVRTSERKLFPSVTLCDMNPHR